MALWVGVTGIVDLVKEYRTIERLEQHGTVQTVPLINISTEGKTIPEVRYMFEVKTFDVARYEFNGSIREQNITKDQSQRWWGQDTVEILVDGNTTRIKGSKPDYWAILGGMLFITVGVVASWIGFLMDRAILRSVRKEYRNYKRLKHNRPKRKRGLPEV